MPTLDLPYDSDAFGIFGELSDHRPPRTVFVRENKDVPWEDSLEGGLNTYASFMGHKESVWLRVESVKQSWEKGSLPGYMSVEQCVDQFVKDNNFREWAFWVVHRYEAA